MHIKKILSVFLICVILTQPAIVYGDLGDMCFFGGIIEGRKLPKTTELKIKETESKKKSSNETVTMPYKEIIFLEGEPQEFNGVITVRNSGDVDEDKDAGTYTMNYQIVAGDATADDVIITRRINFDVNWYRDRTNNQIIKDYDPKTWTESIVLPGGTYTMNRDYSHFSASYIEDHTPGVVYSKGNISTRVVYTNENNETVTLETLGTIYGYHCAWSSTETHRLDGYVTRDDWSLQYQVRPSVSLNKTLQYSRTEPTSISFEGNYAEVMENTSGIEYDIFVKPRHLYDLETSGKSSIPSVNSFEQLIAPNTSYLKGHFAEEDIRKLFSMEILTGDPKMFQPSQAITRGQYVSGLIRAVKLPVEDPTAKKSKKNQTVEIVFPDVQPEDPVYPYVMAAYHAGITVGRQDGYFFSDAPMERQEAIVLLMRTLGLENLGLDPTPVTSFTDDHEIADWARKEIYAANRIGIIYGDEDGRIHPTAHVSKAEGAAFLNLLIDYMRSELPRDYAEHIVNYGG